MNVNKGVRGGDGVWGKHPRQVGMSGKTERESGLCTGEDHFLVKAHLHLTSPKPQMCSLRKVISHILIPVINSYPITCVTSIPINSTSNSIVSM